MPYHHNGPTSKTAGPAAIVSSVTVVLQPVNTTYVWPEMGAVPLGAVGTVREKPPSTGVALYTDVSTEKSDQRIMGKGRGKGKKGKGIRGEETYGAKTGPVTVMKAP